MKISMIIPLSAPDEATAGYIEDLIKNKAEDIILVTDNEKSHEDFLRKAADHSEVTVVYAKKPGRGAAIREAFRFLSENRKDTDGALCCEEDGRYPYEALDICIKAFEKDPGCVVMGSRDPEKENIPVKKRACSKISGLVYRFATGIRLKDTQSSLRLIPAGYFEYFAKLPGKSKDYETRMLIGIMNKKISYTEVSVPVISHDEKDRKNLSTFKDRIIVYSIVLAYFLKFAISSVSSYLIDMGIYALLLFFLENRLSVGGQVLVCTVVSRIISSLFNFTINRKTVFKATDKLAAATVRYYIIAVIKLAASYALIYFFTDLLGITGFAQLIIKALVDIVLFLFSFQFQKNWVFKNKNV